MNAKIISFVVGLALGAGTVLAVTNLSGEEVRVPPLPRISQQEDLAAGLSELAGEIARLRSSIEKMSFGPRTEGIAEVPVVAPSGSAPVSSHELSSAAEGSLEALKSMKEKELLATLLVSAKSEAAMSLERAKSRAQAVDRSGSPAPGAEGARQGVELWTRCLQEIGDAHSIEGIAAVIAKYNLETGKR